MKKKIRDMKEEKRYLLTGSVDTWHIRMNIIQKSEKLTSSTITPSPSGPEIEILVL